jgi:hypothetical protein
MRIWRKILPNTTKILINFFSTNKDKELPSLKELEDLFNVFIYNDFKLIVKDINKINSLVKGINIIIIP